jgi:hypothetical protein
MGKRCAVPPPDLRSRLEDTGSEFRGSDFGSGVGVWGLGVGVPLLSLLQT